MLPTPGQLKALQAVTGIKRDPASVAAYVYARDEFQGMGRFVDREEGDGGSPGADDATFESTENAIGVTATFEQPHHLIGYGVEDPESGSRPAIA